MLNGLRFNKKPKNIGDENSEKKQKRAILICSLFIIVAVGYTLFQIFFGSSEEKAEIINMINNNFHISKIDIIIVSILAIIMIILKIKKRNDLNE